MDFDNVLTETNIKAEYTQPDQVEPQIEPQSRSFVKLLSETETMRLWVPIKIVAKFQWIWLTR